MATADFEQVKDLVAKYGDKATIGRMAAMGMVEPTTAVLAGMMIDRITQQNMKPPTTTVAQDVLAPQPPAPQMQPPAQPQPGQPDPAMQGQPQPGMPQQPQPMPQQPQPQPQMMRAGGVAALDVPDNMYDSYAGGGVVAFSQGGMGLRNTFITEERDRPGLEAARARAAERRDALSREADAISQIYRERGLTGLLGEGFGKAFRPVTEAHSRGLAASADLARGVGSGIESLLFGPEPVARAKRAAEQDVDAAGAGFTPYTPNEVAAMVENKGQGSAGQPSVTNAPTTALRFEAPRLPPRPLQSDISTEVATLSGPLKRDLPPEKTSRQAISEFDSEFVAAGGDPEFFKKEAARVREQREELKGDRTQAANMRLIEAGLAMMGGESPYAFVNIGKGASQAMKGFAEDVKELRKNRIELDKAERELGAAQNQFAISKTAEARKRVERSQDRRDRIDDKNTEITANLTTAIYGANRADARADRGYEADFAKAKFTADAQAAISAEDRASRERIAERAYGARGAATDAAAMREALKYVDMGAVRTAVAKSQGLPKTPAEGVNATFDKKVAEEYNRKLREIANSIRNMSEAQTTISKAYPGFSLESVR